MVKFLHLFVLVFLPILAGLLVISPFFPNQNIKIRRFAKGIMVFELIYSACFLACCNYSSASLQFMQSLPFNLIPDTGITVAFGVDVLSSLMCLLTALIGLMALIGAKSMIVDKYKVFYSLMLILTGSLMGYFAAFDFFTFFLFFELELIPMYFLISLFGGEKAKKSAVKFVLYTFFGSLFMLAAIALLYAYAYDTNSIINLEILRQKASSYPIFLQFVASIGFLIAFGIKLPVFPLHTWLADAHTDAPTPVSMMLAGVLLKTGAYGIIRINLQGFSDVFEVIAPSLILLGTINVLWASFCAIAQIDIKRIIAYSSIAHMGIILTGIASCSYIGLSGAIFQMASHALISAGLFMFCGIIYLRVKTRKLELLGGLEKYMPKLMKLTFILCLAAISLPFTMGFAGEILCLFGAFNSPLLDTSYPLHQYIQIFCFISALSIILSVIYILRMFHHTFFQTVSNISLQESRKIPKDISNHQGAVLVTLALALLLFGIYPMGILDTFNNFTNTVINHIEK